MNDMRVCWIAWPGRGLSSQRVPSKHAPFNACAFAAGISPTWQAATNRSAVRAGRAAVHRVQREWAPAAKRRHGVVPGQRPAGQLCCLPWHGTRVAKPSSKESSHSWRWYDVPPAHAHMRHTCCPSCMCACWLIWVPLRAATLFPLPPFPPAGLRLGRGQRVARAAR